MGLGVCDLAISISLYGEPVSYARSPLRVEHTWEHPS